MARLPWWLKESTCQCRRHKGLWFNPRSGRSPGRGNGNSIFLAWKIPWTEEPGRPQSTGPAKESDRTAAQWLAHSRHSVNDSCCQQSREVRLHLGTWSTRPWVRQRDTGPPANSRFAQCQGLFQRALLRLLGTVCLCAKKSQSCRTGPKRKTQELKLGGHREGLLVGLPPREPAAGESPF